MKYAKILSLLLAVISVCSLCVVPVFAAEDEEIPTIGEGNCKLTLTLKDFETDVTDNIQFKIKNKDTREVVYIVFTKENKWQAEVAVQAGTYVLTYDIADNNREIVLESATISVPSNTDSASAELVVKKVLNNSFFPKFFRNNTFLLILLAISSVTYFILKKRRENSLA